MKNPLLKYIAKEKKENIFHSSGYGRAQNGAGIGVSSSESFQKRMEINNNRQNIEKYGDSKIARQRNNLARAKQYTPLDHDEAPKTFNVNMDGRNSSSRPQQTRGNTNPTPVSKPSTPPRYKTNFGR